MIEEIKNTLNNMNNCAEVRNELYLKHFNNLKVLLDKYSNQLHYKKMWEELKTLCSNAPDDEPYIHANDLMRLEQKHNIKGSDE